VQTRTTQQGLLSAPVLVASQPSNWHAPSLMAVLVQKCRNMRKVSWVLVFLHYTASAAGALLKQSRCLPEQLESGAGVAAADHSRCCQQPTAGIGPLPRRLVLSYFCCDLSFSLSRLGNACTWASQCMPHSLSAVLMLTMCERLQSGRYGLLLFRC
jgi:hypothetical protein